MLDIKDFNFLENQNTFDFKGFLIKLLSYWKWFVFTILFFLVIAYQVNLRKQKIYSIDTTIGVKDEDNPLFTSNTSLVFNWGGTSDKVSTIASTLKSRSHNELVVDKLNYFIDYSVEDKYYMKSVYGDCPFQVELDKNYPQLGNIPIEVEFISPTAYILKIDFESPEAKTYNYLDFSSKTISVKEEEFTKKYAIGQQVVLPFLNWKLNLSPNSSNYVGKKYFVTFNDFNSVVANYQNLRVDIDDKSPSILKLSLEGTNKAKIVDYLNETVKVLMKNQLDKKNLFADNTIHFIDTTLALMETKLKAANNDLKSFSKNKNVIQLEEGGASLQSQLLDLDLEKDEIDRKIDYYNKLSVYLRNSKEYSKLPAPSVAGIDDPNILINVSKIIELSVKRSEMEYSVKSPIMFNDIDNEINSLKTILQENIRAAKSAILFSKNLINSKISKAEGTIQSLPDDKQELIQIMRKYNLSDNIYQTYLQKRSEASIVKAANLSDIQFIDSAKDIGGGLIGPKTNVNYVIAVLLGLLIPLLLFVLLFTLNNTIQNTDDLSRLTSIPIIGVVGVKSTESYLSVFEQPKSSLSESFRAIRSSLQFLYKKQHLTGSKTLMLTSTISGEGKTFCSLNIATVFALSEKKTVIVGLDLRKPKIFDDFGLTNSVGVVNYLIGQKSLEEITNKTHIPYLDVITSGPIPPNPSELILSDAMSQLMTSLKEKYDYIILDTPPVGLVSDSLELVQYSDVNIYVMRQNVTKKAMLHLLNNSVKRGELDNVSIILNGYENKAKYGASYTYGQGYGNYSDDYFQERKRDKIWNYLTKLLKIKQK